VDEVPADVVTVISTVPGDSAGAVALMDVALETVNVVAAIPPNFTAIAPVKAVPVIVTKLPPVVNPDGGETPVTTGIAGAGVVVGVTVTLPYEVSVPK
jgi:hypothetical protein